MDFQLLNQVFDDCEQCGAYSTKDGCSKDCPVYNTKQSLMNALATDISDWPMDISMAVPRL